MTATHQQAEKVESTEPDVKQRLHAAIDALPEEVLSEVASFVEYQRYKLERRAGAAATSDPPYEPVKLGGLWKGVRITEEDFAGAREDMLSSTRKRSEKA